MTKRRPDETPEQPAVRETLVSRACAWCGAPVGYSGNGRPPRYCSGAHRRRAWELRSAQDRADAPVDAGGRSPDPVREVVLRTETVVRSVPVAGPPAPAVRLSGAPHTLPEDAVEWVQALAYLRRTAPTHPGLSPFLQQLARACERTARVLREADTALAVDDQAQE
ncbi:hypothetical protein ACIQU5_35075 [Streptomyces sp. NPDC090306]|uniref:hypothetical protein n=1 Tax=Streptomyces sp. NPDC090306 TaxID=3365961 RepID=UPI00380C4A29